MAKQIDKTFIQPGHPTSPWQALNSAKRWLKAHGYSYGRLQRGARIAVYKGDCVIGKWRTLSTQDRAEMDGYLMPCGSRFRGNDCRLILEVTDDFEELPHTEWAAQ
jgi:hypothetical protein